MNPMNPIFFSWCLLQALPTSTKQSHGKETHRERRSSSVAFDVRKKDGDTEIKFSGMLNHSGKKAELEVEGVGSVLVLSPQGNKEIPTKKSELTLPAIFL